MKDNKQLIRHSAYIRWTITTKNPDGTIFNKIHEFTTSEPHRKSKTLKEVGEWLISIGIMPKKFVFWLEEVNWKKASVVGKILDKWQGVE